MKSYKSKESYFIKARGVVFVVENEKDRNDFNDLIGEMVSINGWHLKVRAVEAFCIRPVKKGAVIGLLVSV